MRREDAGRHAFLFDGGDIGFHHAAALAFIDESGERRIVARGVRGKRVLGRDRDERDTHDGIGAGREHPELFLPSIQRVRKREPHAVALADPVRLHRFHAVGPAGQRVERGEQLVGVARDRHVVHRDLALFHERAGAPAAAVDHLLVREHRLVDRVPVDDAGLLVDEAALEHAQEEPLVPAVVIGLAGRELAVPVDREAERLQLLLHVRDVVVRPLRGRHAVRHRRVFRRQPERIPSHRLQHVVAFHAVVTGEHIAYGIVAHVPHMQLA